MRLTAIKDRHLVAAAQGVLNLERPGESGAAENQNVHGLRWTDDVR